MQLGCPFCSTAFYVDPDALGGGGRNVRCTRCGNIWFASPAELLPEPIPEPAAAMVSDDADAVVPPAVPVSAASADTATLERAALVDVRAAPPLAPEIVPAHDRQAAPPNPSIAAGRRRSRRVTGKDSERARLRLFAVTMVLAAIVLLAVGLRTNLVRALPQLGSLYASVGLAVNLRGLDFRQVRTLHESHEGTAVLVIEGEIANITAQPIELPRLRLAAIGPQGQELYSWTAVLPETAIAEQGSIRFRSRLASPPAEARAISVRFLRRGDLAAD
jgi:predicted Zn finger-like uncharacterized protein